jgi:hypothetical protein
MMVRSEKWRKENPDKVRAMAKDRYHNHPNSEKHKEEVMRWKSENSERNKAHIRAANLKRNYGITIAEFDAMLLGQGGVCKICGGDNSGKVLHVDHNHRTGNIRALLCGPCNVGLGSFKDDVERIMRAAEYLTAHEWEEQLVAREEVA